MATASSVSKMLKPEAFTGSNDFESHLTHIELNRVLIKRKKSNVFVAMCIVRIVKKTG